MLLFKQKYEQLGKFSGIVYLNNPSIDEKEIIGKYFRDDYSKSSKIKVSLKQFEKIPSTLKYGPIDGTLLLEKYFNKTIITNKENKEIKLTNQNIYFNELLIKYKNTFFEKFLNHVLINKASPYKKLIEQYNKDNKALKLVLINLANCLNNLPIYENKTERLAVFIGRITNDPHFLDNNAFANTFFIQALNFIIEENDLTTDQIMEQSGLIKDEVSNYTLTYALLGNDGLQYYYDTYQPIILTLFNINQLNNINSKYKKVFVVENPSVFMGIFDTLKELHIPLICTYGQLKASTILLLNKLVANHQIYYSGDFDPEGLGIANQLKNLYKNKLTLMLYENDYYLKSISNKQLTENRLVKLEKINIAIDIVEEMKTIKRPGYQEKLLPELIELVKEEIK